MPNPWTHALPPNTRAVGTVDPANDANASVDALTAMGAGSNVLNPAFAGGADPSGGSVAQTTAAWQAAMTAGGLIIVPPGTYTINATLTGTVPVVIFCPGGKWATTVNFTGTGDCIRIYNPVVGGGNVYGSAVKGLTIDGTSAGAGSAGLHIGDMDTFELDVAVQNFSGAGSVGVHFDNTIWFTEETRGYIWSHNNTSAVVFDISSPATTVAAGSNGGTISGVAAWGTPSAGVLAVASTAGYPAAGTVNVAASGATTAVVTYTGITSSTLTGCAYVSGSPAGTVATGGAVTLVTSSNSFDYSDLDIEILAVGNQDGVVFQNGALMVHGRLTVKANFQASASVLTNAVLRITGAVPAGHSQAAQFSAIVGGRLDVQAEVPTGAHTPQTIVFGTAGSNCIRACTGILDFAGGTGTFTPTNWSATSNAGGVVYSGVIRGDVNLSGAGNIYAASQQLGALGYGLSFLSGSNGNMQGNNGDFFAATLSASITMSLAAGAALCAMPQRKTIVLKQAVAGNFTVAWPHNGSPTTSAPTVLWAGGTAPVMTAAANAVDVYRLDTADGVTWYGTASQNVS